MFQKAFTKPLPLIFTAYELSALLIQADFSAAAPLIERACKEGADIIALPELFKTGYCCFEREWSYAEDLYGETAEFLWDFAQRYGCTLIGGFSERAEVAGLCYNSLMLISPHAEKDSCRKMYLWGDEKNRFIRGRDIKLWSLNGVADTPRICYEAGFPEPLNVFMNVPVLEDGSIGIELPKSKAGDYMVVEALEDLYVLMSSCSNDVPTMKTNAGNVTDMKMEVYAQD